MNYEKQGYDVISNYLVWIGPEWTQKYSAKINYTVKFSKYSE